MKSVEQKLFEALRCGRGVRLTSRDVVSLAMDDAVATRISNQAASEAGLEEPLGDCLRASAEGMSWGQFGKFAGTPPEERVSDE